jgi:hypothetical protein
VLNLLPVLILHVILLPLNGWRLMEALKQRSAMADQSSVPLRSRRRCGCCIPRPIMEFRIGCSKPLFVAKHIGPGQRRAESRPFYFEDEQGQRIGSQVAHAR